MRKSFTGTITQRCEALDTRNYFFMVENEQGISRRAIVSKKNHLIDPERDVQRNKMVRVYGEEVPNGLKVLAMVILGGTEPD